MATKPVLRFPYKTSINLAQKGFLGIVCRMKILFVADGRSPIALNWIKYWTRHDHDVHLVSTYPGDVELPLARMDILPVAFSRTKSSGSTSTVKQRSLIWGAATLKLRLALRHWLGPLTLPQAAARLNQIVNDVQPDLVHALRVPYEGMLAGLAKSRNEHFPPLLISIWGNDFTLHAPSSPMMRHYTKLALRNANALHADCERDIRLAAKWGFYESRPSIILPGAGGIDMSVFYAPKQVPERSEAQTKDESSRNRSSSTVSSLRSETAPLIINPRGFRGYVRNDTFFKAIPLVLAARPDTKFICPTMAGESQAEAWVQTLGIAESVTLTPPLAQNQLADTFRSAQILVSPSTHDGTPNSVIEGMACGCFPICGDLDSIREWITDGINGLLIDPSSPQQLADAILRALNDASLRQQALEENQTIIAKRAEYERCMAKAEKFYQKIIKP